MAKVVRSAEKLNEDLDTAEENIVLKESITDNDVKLALKTNKADIQRAGFSTAVGEDALLDDDGSNNYNTANGASALRSNTTGYSNTANGSDALRNNTIGYNNTANGNSAATINSPFNITTESNRIVLGDNNITNAYIKVAWTVTSDKRDKADIKPITNGLDFINKLNPVSFKWDDRSDYWETKKDGEIIKHKRDGSKKKKIVNVGFISQEVHKVEKSLNFPNDIVADTEQKEKYLLKETAIIPYLVKSIQELSKEIEILKSKRK